MVRLDIILKIRKSDGCEVNETNFLYVNQRFRKFKWTHEINVTSNGLLKKIKNKNKCLKIINYLRLSDHVNQTDRQVMAVAQNLFAAIVQRKQPFLRYIKFTGKKNTK